MIWEANKVPPKRRIRLKGGISIGRNEEEGRRKGWGRRGKLLPWFLGPEAFQRRVFERDDSIELSQL